MKTKNHECFTKQSIIENFNDIMKKSGYSWSTVTDYSNNNWNLRDMVAECDYILEDFKNDIFLKGHNDFDVKYWSCEMLELLLFIKKYEPFISGVKCTEKHHSENYDN